MKVSQAIERLGLKALAGVNEDSLEREIEGCYIGDLLSWVMARASSGDAWITVMGNINALAVASLTDSACIILAENATLDENARLKSDSAGIPVLSSEEKAYELAVRLHELIS